MENFREKGNLSSIVYQLSSVKGGIAQLVERLLCKQEVAGSNPTASTSTFGTIFLIFENWKIGIEENCNVNERRGSFLPSVYGRTTDALAS